MMLKAKLLHSQSFIAELYGTTGVKKLYVVS